MLKKILAPALLLSLAACNVELKSDDSAIPREAVSIERTLVVGTDQYRSNQFELDSSVSRGAIITMKLRSAQTGNVRLIPGFAAGINCDIDKLGMKVQVYEGLVPHEGKDLPHEFPVSQGGEYEVRLVIQKNTCEALSFSIDAKYL